MQFLRLSPNFQSSACLYTLGNDKIIFEAPSCMYFLIKLTTSKASVNFAKYKNKHFFVISSYLAAHRMLLSVANKIDNEANLERIQRRTYYQFRVIQNHRCLKRCFVQRVKRNNHIFYHKHDTVCLKIA